MENPLFRELFDQMPQLGWTARSDGYIDFYNRGWYAYTGKTFEEMSGWGWQSVHDTSMLDEVNRQWSDSIASGRDFEMEFPLRRHDGELRWFLTRVRPIRAGDGSIVRWVGINTDVTHIRELRRSIERERANLREVFELAPAFMARLRAPNHIFEAVNASYVRLVGEGRNILGLPVREALPEIEGQGFFELLDGVYETGKPWVGTEVPVRVQRGDVEEERFIDFVYQATRDGEGRVDGVFAHGTDVTAQVRARQQMEEQAVELRRAKFTPKGGTVILRISHSGSMVRLTVKDSGQGISADLLPFIFEPFRQGDTSTTRVHGGIGLGLSIVRSIVELHGGAVTAESAGEGLGATFTVEFPILESAPTNAESISAGPLISETRASSELPMLSDVAVLVVDDQKYTREVAAAILRRAHATVHVACSVSEGLELLREHEPDVVVCDIAMPEADGYAFVREVRSMKAPASETPIIALTAYSRPQDRLRALNEGFNDYLQKPVEPVTLAEAVRRLSGGRA